MTPADLNALAHDIAEAAAKCVVSSVVVGKADAVPAWTREDPGAVGIIVTARAGEWLACGDIHGHPSAALNSAAVLALRDRVVAQREERARMLAADDAALRVIDETARVYDAETVREAVRGMVPGETAGEHASLSVIRVLHVFADGADASPWTGAAIDRAANCLLLDGKPIVLRIACDAILRRRAGTP